MAKQLTMSIGTHENWCEYSRLSDSCTAGSYPLDTTGLGGCIG